MTYKGKAKEETKDRSTSNLKEKTAITFRTNVPRWPSIPKAETCLLKKDIWLLHHIRMTGVTGVVTRMRQDIKKSLHENEMTSQRSRGEPRGRMQNAQSRNAKKKLIRWGRGEPGHHRRTRKGVLDFKELERGSQK
jgi:hypothetical protein